MSAPNPFLLPRAWSTLKFQGKTSATVTLGGTVQTINGHDPTELWVVQKAQNTSFAVTIWRGRMLNESIKIELILTDAAAFTAYTNARDLLQPKPPAPGSPFKQPVWTVINGALNWGGITRVGIRSIGAPRAQKDLGYAATIDLIQYRPQVISAVGPPDPPKVETENDRKAARLKDAITKARKL